MFFLLLQKEPKSSCSDASKVAVASFGVSETAETGSIVSGREQDDHVSRSRLCPATSVQNFERGSFY